MTDRDRLLAHYGKPGLLARIDAGLRASGIDPQSVTRRDLAAVDEFHLRGPQATDELIALLDPTPEMKILDLGAGLGGPARHLADARGCRVVGLDLTEEYCDVGNELSRRVGLLDRVTLRQGDVTRLSEVENASFDAAWTIHVGMNIRDKPTFYDEVRRVLKPASRFLVFDVVRAGDAEPVSPLPWSDSADTSFLARDSEMKVLLVAAGFQILQEDDQSDKTKKFIQQTAAKARQAGGPPPLGLQLVLGPIFREIMPNLVDNLMRGALYPKVYLCQKPA